MSSGTFPDTFHCGSDRLAQDWQRVVRAFRRGNSSGLVLSPAIADPSKTGSIGDYSRCGRSPQMQDDHMDECLGWLRCFKASVSKLSCGETDCWDAIDIIQFHAYFYTAQDLIAKVKQWESAWADELNGRKGLRRKSLWLTEFAHAGTTDASDPDGEGRHFMERSVEYLKASPYVSGWSWFSQSSKTFHSFTIDGVVPAAKFWASELIDGSGALTALGEKYTELCRGLAAGAFAGAGSADVAAAASTDMADVTEPTRAPTLLNTLADLANEGVLMKRDELLPARARRVGPLATAAPGSRWVPASATASVAAIAGAALVVSAAIAAVAFVARRHRALLAAASARGESLPLVEWA
jgi:hypothetical protein